MKADGSISISSITNLNILQWILYLDISGLLLSAYTSRWILLHYTQIYIHFHLISHQDINVYHGNIHTCLQTYKLGMYMCMQNQKSTTQHNIPTGLDPSKHTVPLSGPVELVSVASCVRKGLSLVVGSCGCQGPVRLALMAAALMAVFWWRPLLVSW